MPVCSDLSSTKTKEQTRLLPSKRQESWHPTTCNNASGRYVGKDNDGSLAFEIDISATPKQARLSKQYIKDEYDHIKKKDIPNTLPLSDYVFIKGAKYNRHDARLSKGTQRVLRHYYKKKKLPDTKPWNSFGEYQFLAAKHRGILVDYKAKLQKAINPPSNKQKRSGANRPGFLTYLRKRGDLPPKITANAITLDSGEEYVDIGMVEN